VAFVPGDDVVDGIDGHRIAFQHLEEAPFDQEQHPRDALRAVLAPRFLEDRTNFGFGEAGAGAAGVDAMDEIHDRPVLCG
jgi:hypothetical protein